MNRFRDLCSSSSDSEEQTQQTSQRGRVRQNKRFTETTANNDQSTQVKQQTPIIKKPPKANNLTHPKQSNIFIQTNQYKSQSSLNANEKFIRQNLKSVQQQIKHYLEKMQNIITDRKKFTNAIKSANRDLQKVQRNIEQLKYQNNKAKNYQIIPFESSHNESTKKQQQKIMTMVQLQSKIQRHLSDVMTEHHKTIESLILCRKQMEKFFQKIKFNFLDLNSVQLFEQQSESYQQYGIEKIYKIISQADSIVNQYTSFQK